MDSVLILPVLVAGVVAFALGWIWYGPLFGKQWRRLVGLSLEDMKRMKMTPLAASAGGIITSLLMAYVLAHGIAFGDMATGMSGVGGALTGAFWYWLGFAVPMTSMGYLWEGKSVKLWVLNAGYYLASFLAMGFVIGQAI